MDQARDKISHDISIMLVDDHPLLRQALKDVLEKEPDFKIVAEAGDGNEAVKLADEMLPDVVIMDISMPNLNGLEATRQIKSRHAGMAVLVLTVHTEDEYILSILEAGAAGYLLKSVFGDEVVQAIRSVASGDIVLSQPIGRRVLQFAARYPIKAVDLEAGEKLSSCELEIMKLAARGLPNKEIASTLGIGLRTVKGHLADIFSKLRVGSRTEAIVTGLRMGILTMEDLQ